MQRNHSRSLTIAQVLALIIATVIGVASIAWVPRAEAAFFCKAELERAALDEVRGKTQEGIEVRRQYPAIDARINAAVRNLRSTQLGIEKPVKRAGEIPDRTKMRVYDGAKPDLGYLDPVLARTLVGVFNRMIDREGFATYTEELLEEAAIEMARNPTARSRVVIGRLSNGAAGYANATVSKTDWITKGELLAKGELDNQSILKVLVRRARARGQTIAVIPKRNYADNGTRTQEYRRFWDVPARGPFFDKAFGIMSSHGRDMHMLQMDYVYDVIMRETGGKPEIFWNYATRFGTGTWVWDTMFDGREETFMRPEFVAKCLRKFVPLF